MIRSRSGSLGVANRRKGLYKGVPRADLSTITRKRKRSQYLDLPQVRKRAEPCSNLTPSAMALPGLRRLLFLVRASPRPVGGSGSRTLQLQGGPPVIGLSLFQHSPWILMNSDKGSAHRPGTPRGLFLVFCRYAPAPGAPKALGPNPGTVNRGRLINSVRQRTNKDG